MAHLIVLVMPNCLLLKFFSDTWMLRYCEVQDERQIHQIFSAVGILALMGHDTTSFSCPGGSSACRPVIHSTAVSKESSPGEVNPIS
jgi:hypothetical protein